MLAPADLCQAAQCNQLKDKQVMPRAVVQDHRHHRSTVRGLIIAVAGSRPAPLRQMQLAHIGLGPECLFRKHVPFAASVIPLTNDIAAAI